MNLEQQHALPPQSWMEIIATRLAQMPNDFWWGFGISAALLVWVYCNTVKKARDE